MIFGFITLFWMWKKKPEKKEEEPKNRYSLIYLGEEIHRCLSEMIHFDFSKYQMKQSELMKRRNSRALLRKALDACALADSAAKDYVKEYIKALLQKECGITPETIEKSIPFDDVNALSVRDKFDILLYIYRTDKGKGREAFAEMMKQYGLSERRREGKGREVYEIRKEDIELIYLEEAVKLSFPDKLEILAQRIFSMDKGNGIVDDLIYQKLDGVSGGMRGNEESSWESVYIMLEGKTIHLRFLSFESEKELSRICKNIYKFDAPGQLSRSSGYIVNQLKSGARVSDMRPPFSNNWCFWIRMFDSVEKKRIEELYPHKGNQILAKLLSFIIKGEQTCVISGQQGTGKTTCLAALIDYIDPALNIRTIELTFELQLNKAYPERNIAAIRETKTVSTENAIEFVKKTDADVVIFGEIAKETEGEKMIKIAQSGSRFTLSTHHGVSTEALIKWFRNALLHSGGFGDETAAREQVTDVVRFDIHVMKKEDGERYIARITEIVPQGKDYKICDILRYIDGEYRMIQRISKSAQERMFLNLKEREQKEFLTWMEDVG